MVQFSSIYSIMQWEKRATVWSENLLNKMVYVYHLVIDYSVCFPWLGIPPHHSVLRVWFKYCQQLEALIGAGIITRNVEVDPRAICASSVISESLIELLWIKCVSVSNSGAGPAVLQWQSVAVKISDRCDSFVIFLRDAYLSQGMSLPIACHGPYAITCWFSHRFMAVSDKLAMLWLKNDKIEILW